MDNAVQSAEGRVVLEPFSYVPPPGYADVTNYAYRGESEVPRLKVHYVASLDEIGGLDAALADYQRQVERFLKAHVDSVSPAGASGRAGDPDARFHIPRHRAEGPLPELPRVVRVRQVPLRGGDPGRVRDLGGRR